MRFWLAEAERRPDPAPARADARKAVLAGTVLWLVALVVCLIVRAPLAEAGLGWLVWACAVGAVIGVIALFVVQEIRRRAGRQSSSS
jgi:RsiW-degrading membrane proteinase PrsW (M82 family)